MNETYSAWECSALREAHIVLYTNKTYPKRRDYLFSFNLNLDLFTLALENLYFNTLDREKVQGKSLGCIKSLGTPHPRTPIQGATAKGWKSRMRLRSRGLPTPDLNTPIETTYEHKHNAPGNKMKPQKQAPNIMFVLLFIIACSVGFVQRGSDFKRSEWLLVHTSHWVKTTPESLNISQLINERRMWTRDTKHRERERERERDRQSLVRAEWTDPFLLVLLAETTSNLNVIKTELAEGLLLLRKTKILWTDLWKPTNSR